MKAMALTTEQELWLSKQLASSPVEPNPCVRAYGRGPEGVSCRYCKHLQRKRCSKKTYLKCELRANTNGPGTDHKAGWNACAKFV
jgi:hypothetical protein